MSLQSLLDSLPHFENGEILKSFVKGYSIINHPMYKNVVCSISGGSDSDIVLDIVSRIDVNKKVRYVWFDTGVEYQATKNHLDYLEARYNIEFEKYRAIKSIPVCCNEYGQPFLSKLVSETIGRLQKYNFQWEDRPFEELAILYPKCVSAVKWWCNEYTRENNFKNPAQYDIGYNRFLKEFLIKNPPDFKISDQCCNWAKKKVAKNIECDLMITGIRRAEGGIRSVSYKNCYSSGEDTTDSYRPVFWFTATDKTDYENTFDIVHSDCYTKYGFSRTGCVCCPFGKDVFYTLSRVEKYEPLLYKTANNIFGDSYEYTRKYREFAKKQKEKEKYK